MSHYQSYAEAKEAAVKKSAMPRYANCPLYVNWSEGTEWVIATTPEFEDDDSHAFNGMWDNSTYPYE